MRRDAALLFAWIAIGCGEEQRPGSLVREEPPAPRPAPVEANPAAPSAPARRAELTAAERRELAARVAEARGLARQERWADALAIFERALTMDPGSARLRCETGFAAFRAGRLEEADRYVSEARRGLPDPAHTPERLRVPLAMCLYNAGLVHEARGRTAEAREAFAQSIALRPNATVQARLEGLGAEVGAPADELVQFEGVDDHTIVARLTVLTCMNAGLDEGDCSGLASPNELRRPANVGPGDPYRAFIATTRFESNTPFIEDWLVLRSGERAAAGRVASSTAHGLLDCEAAGVSRFEWVDLVAGGEPELVLDAEACEIAASSWQCESTDTTERHLFVCAVGDPFRCASVPLGDITVDWWSEDCEDGAPNDEGQRERRGFRVDAELASGALVLRRATGDPPPLLPIGTTRIDALLARDDLRWRGEGALTD